MTKAGIILRSHLLWTHESLRRAGAVALISLMLNMMAPLAVLAAGSTAAPAGPAVAHLAPPPGPKGGVRRASKAVTIFKPTITFSADPTDADISSASLFSEAIEPMSSSAVAGENAALAKAILAFKAKNGYDDLSDLTEFLSDFPKSRWKPAIESVLAHLYFSRGRISKAHELWASAWEAAKGETGAGQVAVANRAYANLVLLDARLGRVEELQKYFEEAKDRAFYGSDEEMVAGAKEGLRCMIAVPGSSFKCGPYALNTLLNLTRKTNALDPVLKKAASTSKGTNLAQVSAWAKEVGLNYVPAKRAAGAPYIVPSVVHLKVGHFTAMVENREGKYLLKDPTFGNDCQALVSASTLDEESDGYFLVPLGRNQSLPDGWTPVGETEAGKVWGRGGGTGGDTGCTGWVAPSPPCLIPALSCCNGMAQPSAVSQLASLKLSDIPLSYSPPIGPNMEFRVDYAHKQTNQPATFKFTNLGQNWNFNWLSYLTVDSAGTHNATLRLMGGGTEVYVWNAGTSSYPAADQLTQATLSVSGATYTRTLPDGSTQIYDQPDTSSNIFMTKYIDPQGNKVTINYDAKFRITSIVDALGQATTITYASTVTTDTGYYKIAKITDPFGRFCQFFYDTATNPTYLLTINDVINLSSKFVYDPNGSFITQLTTPYGTTSFYQYIPQTFTDSHSTVQVAIGGLKFVFPDGTSAVLESWINELKSTFYWNRHAMQLYPGDAGNHIWTNCQATQWVYNAATTLTEPAWQNKTSPLESALTYSTHPGQAYGGNAIDYSSGCTLPRAIIRNLPGAPTTIATIGPNLTVGDKIAIGIFNNSTLGTYTVASGDTPTSVASGLANLINASSAPPNLVTALAAGNTITLNSTYQYSYNYAYSVIPSTGPETVTFTSPTPQTANMTIGGTITNGDTVSLAINYICWPYSNSLGTVTKTYPVTGADTPTTIATGLVNAINADATLSQFMTATNTKLGSAGPVINISSTAQVPHTYVPSFGGAGTETLTVTDVRNVQVQCTSYEYNSKFNVTQQEDPVGRTISYVYAANGIDVIKKIESAGSHNKQLGAWTYNGPVAHKPDTYTDGSGQVTQYVWTQFGQLKKVTDANSNTSNFYYPETTTITVGGTISNNHLQTITIFDPALPGGQQAATYTEHTGDTTTTIAAGLVASINGNANLQAAGITATNSANVITVVSNSPNLTTFTKTVTGTITLTIGATNYGYLTKIDGPLAGSYDVTAISYDGFGRTYSVTDSQGATESFLYDDMNRQTQHNHPDGSSDKTVWNRLDPVLMTDRIGRCTQKAFDSVQQVAYEIDPLGRKTQYTWCTCGSLVALQDPAGNTTSWQHDLQGRTLRKTYQDGKHNDIAYDPALGRPTTLTDAASQITNYTYYVDDKPFQTYFTNATNPTGVITQVWDIFYSRLASVANDWGTKSFTYNPYINSGGSPTTGGGMLQLVHLSPVDNSLPNSDTTYLYDVLGRTTNRSINGAANSDTWTFDAISRVTGETNTLGSFGFSYVDDVSGSSKGDPRLASVTYPNSQVTNYDWYAPNQNERLRQIANLKSASGATLSQYSHMYDAQGQMTRWQQIQGNQSLDYSLNYDLAGQLLSSRASAGGATPAYIKQNAFAYDLASNRTSVQHTTVDRVVVGGTITSGNTVTVTVNNPDLSGGAQVINYSVVVGDSLASIATALATAITGNTNLQSIGVSATANGATLSIRCAYSKPSSYTLSTSGGATETLTLGAPGNFVENVVIGGNIGNSIPAYPYTISVRDAGLPSGIQTISYTSASTETYSAAATNIAAAISANSNLSAQGITASAIGPVITIKSNSVNATTYSGTATATSPTQTQTISFSINQNSQQTIVFGGSTTSSGGDVISTTTYNSGLPTGKKLLTYTVAAGNSLTTVATMVASAINADTDLQAQGITATSAATVVTVNSKSLNATTLRVAPNAGNPELVTINPPINGVETAIIGGTSTLNDTVTITVYDPALSTGSKAITYSPVLTTDTPSTIATKLANLITAESSLAAIGVSAVASSNVINIKSTSTNLTTYAKAVGGAGTETVALSPAIGGKQFAYNSVNQLTSISAGGQTTFSGAVNKAIKSATVNAVAAMLPTSVTFTGNTALSSGANSVAVSATDGSNVVTTNNYQVGVKGQGSSSLAYDINGNMLSDGTNSYSWDALNRLIQITYPGTGNNTKLAYDGFSGLVKIVETTGGTITSTKQFIRCGSKICEERNASGTLIKQFFGWGQTITGTNYFYTRDHLGSVRDMTDSSGNVVAHYEYDMWGVPTKTAGALDADFGYAGMYFHQPSGLNLATYRAYNPSLGLWINRDPIGERGGTKLYGYVGNDPVGSTDPTGLWVWYGYYGGPAWAGWSPVSELTDFPYRVGDPGFVRPKDARDLCYYHHDVCLHNAQRILKDSSRQAARATCDQELAQCLCRVKYHYGSQFGTILGSEIRTFESGFWGEGSPNNNTGGPPNPNLTPYNPNYEPPVMREGVPWQ
ncbi:MAG: hypothetical protein JST01_01890 [Cyanobacteria bacterium SZAS TMP-1]|nr:hypothetical protein [Cyanobacteria bacterium SZAS TMP-1]